MTIEISGKRCPGLDFLEHLLGPLFKKSPVPYKVLTSRKALYAKWVYRCKNDGVDAASVPDLDGVQAAAKRYAGWLQASLMSSLAATLKSDNRIMVTALEPPRLVSPEIPPATPNRMRYLHEEMEGSQPYPPPGTPLTSRTYRVMWESSARLASGPSGNGN